MRLGGRVVAFRVRQEPTERILAAMENPHVDCIGHPTARKLNKRVGVDLDIEKIAAKGLETGTSIEINSRPDRLDLRDSHARAVGEAGLPIVISTDSHELGALDFVELGVAQARRAWLTKDQILNSRRGRHQGSTAPSSSTSTTLVPFSVESANQCTAG